MDPTCAAAPPAPAQLPGAARVRLGPDELRTARRCATALGVLGSGSLIGVAFSMYLVSDFPLLLIALSPLGRHLILVAPLVDPVTFVAVAVSRRMLFYLASFHLGRALGPSGIPWLELRAARFARFVRWLERLFGRAPRALVLLVPGPTVSALAGIARMRAGLFAVLAVSGLVVRMLVVLGLGEWLREPLEALLAVIHEYRLPGTLLLVGAIALHQWRRRRRVAARRAA